MRTTKATCALTTLLFASLVGATPAVTQSGGQSAPPAPLRELQACREIADGGARLVCFDRVAAALTTAERKGDVVVVAREQVRAARRQAFGFNLPSLDLFGGRNEVVESIDRASLTLARASTDADGKWLIRTQDGQVWRQTDTERVSRPPRVGSRAEVRKAAMGSYLMNIDGQRAIRVRREQ